MAASRSLLSFNLFKDTVIWTIEIVFDERRILLNQVKESESLESVLKRANIDFDGLKVVMEVYGRPKNAPLFIEVKDVKQSIKDVLKFKDIVEFPTFILKKEIDSSLLTDETQQSFVVPKIYLKNIEKEREQEEEEGSEESSESSESDEEEEEEDLGLNKIFGKKEESKTNNNNNLWF